MIRSALLTLLIIALVEGTPRAAAPASGADEPLSAQGAIALAEEFVAKQGYADLQPKAVGARADSDIWFVGFRAKVGAGIRGIMVAQNGKTLKRVSQNLQLDWLMSKPEEIKELDAAEATSLAETFASGVKGLSQKAAKITENKAGPAGDPWNSWWIWFEKIPKSGSKARSYSIVSVNKETRQMKWIKSGGKPAAP